MKNLNKNITRKKQNNNFIVYIHIRPDINEPFYVGKGVHGREIRTYGRNQYWHNIVNNEEFNGIRYDFQKKYNLRYKGIYNLITNKAKTYKGWKIKELN